MSTILITGATGFIGSHVARHFVNHGDDVHIFSRTNSNTWRINDFLSKVTVHIVDLLDLLKLNDVIADISPDIIFHFANVGVYGGKSVNDLEMQQVNLIGLVNLLSSLEDINYKAFVNVGSSSEYGVKTQPMSEDDLCIPMSGYAVSKLASTNYAVMMAKTRCRPITTIRVFSPFGPFDDSSRLISRVNLDLIANKKLMLNNPESVRDYIYIEDIVNFFVEVPVKINTIKGEVFNLGSGVQRNIEQVVNRIIYYKGINLEIGWSLNRGITEPPVWQADMTKTFSIFDWRPETDFDLGIKKTFDWFQSNYNLYN